jgi:hypothetical protein
MEQASSAVRIARGFAWGFALVVEALLGVWIVMGLLLLPDTGAWVSRGIAAAVLTSIWGAGAWTIAWRLKHRPLMACAVTLACLAASAVVFLIGLTIAILAAVRAP